RRCTVSKDHDRAAGRSIHRDPATVLDHWYLFGLVRIECQRRDCRGIPALRQWSRELPSCLRIESDSIAAHRTERVSILRDFRAVDRHRVPHVLPIDVDARITFKADCGPVAVAPERFDIAVVNLVP